MGTGRSGRSRRTGWALAACVAVMTAAACDAKGGRSDYSSATDSGAAAPATQLDTSLTRDRPDSTTGGPDRTGRRGVTGDTLSTRGRPAGTGVRPGDTTRKRP